MLSTHLRLCLPNGLFPVALPAEYMFPPGQSASGVVTLCIFVAGPEDRTPTVTTGSGSGK
jgi:hypothetical protein